MLGNTVGVNNLSSRRVSMGRLTWWDFAYRIYAPWDNEEPPDELIELVEEERIRPGRALDVGCGTGNYTLFLASKGFEAVGVDISSAAIKKARVKAAKRNPNCLFYTADFLDAKSLGSVVEGAFDLVMDYGCFHSITRQDRNRYLPSLKAVTRQGSLYLLWSFHPGSGAPFGWFGVDPREVRELFSQDFQILDERTAPRGKILYIMERKSGI